MSKIEPTAAAASDCPDCALPTRRDLIKRATGAALIGASASAGLFDLFGRPRAAWGAEASVPAATSETMVGQLFKSLNQEQRKTLCFPFGHELQSKVNNNWFIIDKNIGQLLTADQQDLVKQIFMGMHTPE